MERRKERVGEVSRHPSRSTPPPLCGERPKSELTDEGYKEFYKSITGDWEDPIFWFHHPRRRHTQYTTLFYIPARGSRSIFTKPTTRAESNFTSKRVFIMDDSKDLLPQYLPLRPHGIIDSEDLPLQQLSREILQQNKVLTQHQDRQRQKDPLRAEEYRRQPTRTNTRRSSPSTTVNTQGGPLRRLHANRETLLDLVRFKSSPGRRRSPRSPKPKNARVRPRAERRSTTSPAAPRTCAAASTLLEIYKKKGIEVLILDDDIDEIVFSMVPKYGDIDLKAVNKSTTNDDLKDDSVPERAEELKPLLEKIKATLGDARKKKCALHRVAFSPTAHPSSRLRLRTGPQPECAR